MPDNNRITLLIADASVLVRQYILELLVDFEGLEQIYQCGDAVSAVLLLAQHQPHVFILDIRLPASAELSNDIDVLGWTKKHHPTITIILLMDTDYDFAQKRCLQFGADFVIDKSIDIERLPDATMQLMRRLRADAEDVPAVRPL